MEVLLPNLEADAQVTLGDNGGQLGWREGPMAGFTLDLADIL